MHAIMGENNEDRIREVVDNITTHPSFRQTLSNILNQSPTITAASDTSLSSNQLSRPTTTTHNSSVHSTPVHQSNSSINSNRNLNSSINSNASTSSRYTTPNEEFSALFRQGSSRGRSPTFQRGISHRQGARARRRAASVPYARASDILIITIDLEGEKKYLDQKKLYYCPIQRRIGLYVPQRKLILWSTGLCSVKLELIKIGQIIIRRFFNILTDALKKSLEAKTFRLLRLEQLLFQHGRLPV